MKVSTFRKLLINASECKSLETFYIECGGSLPENYYEDNGNAEKAVHVMKKIWELHNNFTFKKVREISGLSQEKFATEYNIPLRTVENWETGTRNPTKYILELLAADVITEE